MPKNYKFYGSNVSIGILFLIISVIVCIIAIRKRKEVPFVKLAEAFVDDKGGNEDENFSNIINNKEDKLKKLINKYDPKHSVE